MSLNVAVLLVDSARRAPAATALSIEDRSVSYHMLDVDADRLAGHLVTRGLRPGDRVGVMLPNVPEFAVAYYGVLKAGGVVVPMNILLKAREVAFYLRDSGARCLIGWAEATREARAGAREAGVEDVIVAGSASAPAGGTALTEVLGAAAPSPLLVPRDADDTAVILYTSGTTGRPKGAELTHSNLLWNAQVSADLFGLSRDDVVFGALPLFHSFGQTCGLNATMRRGASLVLMPRFDAEAALDIVRRAGVTVFLGVPTMYVALLNARSAATRDIGSLRLCVSGGASLPVEVLHSFEHTFGARVLEGYGLSETSPVASFNHLDRPGKPGSIGTPVWGTEMRVVDDAGAPVAPDVVGEIAIRGHHVMKSYWQRPDETTAAIDGDGWLRTGDLARCDRDGYFFVVDRKKELILRGGYNVYPREIEEVLYEHGDVLEAAVFGVPHSELGEEVAAAVVAKPGAAIDPGELRDWVKQRVAAYKYPRRIAVLPSLPKGPTGKIVKRNIDPCL
jgi:long-chain acyl-CoA synthetase